MCYICSCLSSILDAVQRLVTFGLACWMCIVLCIGMIVASCAGIAYGYNYCMAEFLTLTSRSEVTVYMRRGKFYDPPDIKSPLVYPSGRRSGGGFEQELNANMSSDYDEGLRRAREAGSRSLGEAWVKSDDTRRYAERLTKFSDNVDTNDVIMVHVSPSTSSEDTRRANADDSGKFSDSLQSFSSKIKGDDDAETSETTLPSTNLVESTWKFPAILSKVDSNENLAVMAIAPTATTRDARKFGDYVDKTWKFAEQFSKYAGGEKLVMENTPLVSSKPTTTLDTRYRSNVDNSWQFAEQLSKYVDGSKVENNVVRIKTPPPYTNPTTDAAEAGSRAPGYLNFLKPLKTTDSKQTVTPEESNNYKKGRMNPRRIPQKGSDSKIKFVERKHQDSKATLAPMRHWATRSTKASSEEYSSSEEEDEDIVYKSV